jgi:hypothetical protein
MNTAHWHLMLNHIPLVGMLLAAIIFLIGIIIENTVVRRTAFIIMIFSALMIIPAFLTGEGSEDQVESISGVSGAAIERHEELAEAYIFAASVTGILAAVAFFASYRIRYQRLMNFVLLAAVGVTLYMAANLANAGGAIRHTEITNGAAPSSAEQVMPSGEEEDD